MPNTGQTAPKQRHWFKLDNAATIFPGQNTQRWSNIFRFSVVLDREVKPDLLERALEETLARFPCFDVRIRRGFFWYYFEKNDASAPPVMPDIKNPCYRIRFNENRRFLFRVYYRHNRIAVDFYHALCDGYGASRFLCTLAARYLNLDGVRTGTGGAVLDVARQASAGEMEDAFERCATSKAKLRRYNGFVYHAEGTRLPHHTMILTTGFLPLDMVSAKAKSCGVTITEYIAAVLLDVMVRRQALDRPNKKKRVSIQIPVNLRNHFPSDTLRNFVLCMNISVDPMLGEYTFEEILRAVKLGVRVENDPKRLNALMSANRRLQTNPLMRALPLALKKAGIGVHFRISGEQSTSVLFSNFGRVDLPAGMKECVESLIFAAGPGILNGARWGAVGCGNVLALTCSNVYRETDIEKAVFTRFVQAGIPVRVESNKN